MPAPSVTFTPTGTDPQFYGKTHVEGQINEALSDLWDAAVIAVADAETLALAEDAIAARDDAEAASAAATAAQTAAEAARDAAALYDGPWLDTVAALLADTMLTYSAGPGNVTAGDYVRTRAEGFAYEVAASGASNHHVITAGGVKLYVRTNDVRAFGAVGDGITDDTDKFTAAAAQFPTVRVPYSAAGYNVGAGVVPGSATFVFDGGQNQLSGAATGIDVNGLFNIAGHPGGSLFAPALRSSKIHLIAGSIRQDSSNRTRWNFISDANHIPTGISGAFAAASGSSIVLNFDRTFGRVVTLLVGPDETFANNIGMTVGASVGLSAATIKAASRFAACVGVNYDGSAWQITAQGDTNIAPVFGSYGSSTLEVTHGYCRGANISATPWNFSGALGPYIPAIYAVTNSSFKLQWINPGTGALATGAAVAGMKALVTKINNGGIFLDGTNGATVINGTDLSSGNIWFEGIMQE